MIIDQELRFIPGLVRLAALAARSKPAVSSLPLPRSMFENLEP
jgi:hypothetical protein